MYSRRVNNYYKPSDLKMLKIVEASKRLVDERSGRKHLVFNLETLNLFKDLTLNHQNENLKQMRALYVGFRKQLTI